MLRRRAAPTALIPLSPVIVRGLDEPGGQPAPTPLTQAHGPLEVSVGRAVVRVPADFDDEHLRRVVAGLGRAC